MSCYRCLCEPCSCRPVVLPFVFVAKPLLPVAPKPTKRGRRG